MRPVSITRRLVSTVLLLELLSAAALVAAITVHEYRVQLKAFDATLEGTTQSLMGAVQDAEDDDDNVMLDLRSVQLGKDAVYRVEDEQGRVLGAAGEAPLLAGPTDLTVFRNLRIDEKEYRFYSLHGLRIVDPGKASGGVRHSITIVYGTPVGHVWHEVLQAVRFFAIATALLLGITAIIMAWLIRKELSPVHALAREAERISSADWHFSAPASAKNTVELRPLAAALEAALARLQRSFEQQRRFTSDAAHELKTDIAIVKSSLQLLTMRKRTTEEYSRGIALGLDDFTRLEMTVQKMLTLARLEQPINPEVNQSCSLRDAIEDAVYQSKPFADIKNITVNTALAADAKVPIDSRDALLLCSNVLLNALQHSRQESTIQIQLSLNDASAQLTVRDQGEGISDEDRPYLFEPFYRGDPSRSRKSGGTGLGLSICKAICDRAGGSIEISNHPAGGALVTVMLPLLSAQVEPRISASLKAH